MQTEDRLPDDDSPPLALDVACQASTSDWQIHMEQLFHNARDRFPDVVWELRGADSLPSEEVWGHKAIVYARAPPTFQARYFSFRPAPVASPSPYCPSPMPAQSAVSLGVSNPDLHALSRSPSPSPSMAPLQVLRLSTTIASSLFSQELEYLYTGKSFGDAFEFLFDSPDKLTDGNGDKDRIEKLRKDLVFMWRSRLYSDIRIQLTGDFTSSASVSDDPTVTPVFSSHRFILVSRSPYFRTQLLGPFAPPTPHPGQLLTVTLPSPPFTPASLHFSLGFIYTGTLAFSHRTFDLDTAFHIMRSATYLSIVSLHDEIEARIIEEMCHGLFMAYVPFAEYEEITGGKWAAVGCKCRQCARRIPRVLEFALNDDVQNERLANGARRALVGLFGDGWCTPEFASLPSKLRDSLIRGVNKRTIPPNVFPLLYAAHRALIRLDTSERDKEKDRDLTVVRELVLLARSKVDAVLCAESEACFEQPEWLSLLDADGSRFEDGEKVEWVMDAVRRGLNVKNAGIVYQTLVSAILLRPHPQDPNETILSHTSGIRQQVELTRMDIVKWLRTRWFSVQQEGGFDTLEGWALKELSHELEVPVEDLFKPTPVVSTPRTTTMKSTPDNASESFSMTSSIRASVVSPEDIQNSTNLVIPSMPTVTTPARPASSSASTSTTRRAVHRPPSVAPSVASTISRTQRTPTKVATRTPSTASRASAVSPTPSKVTRSPGKPSPSIASSRRSVASSVTSERPKSLAPSVASTIRKASPSTSRSTVAESKTIKAKTPADSRPVSSVSTRSDATSTFKTAKTEVTEPRSRRNSNASTTSIRTTTSTATAGRKRTISNASAASTGPSTPKKVPPVPKRPPSTLSVRSNVSTVSMTNRKAVGKAAAARAVERRESLSRPPAVPSTRTSKITVQDKGKGRAKANAEERISTHTPNASEASTIKISDLKGLSKKLSNETITESISTDTPTVTAPTPRASIIMKENVPLQPPTQSQPQAQSQPHSAQGTVTFGSTLLVGIPCIISSKRMRFRAYARYIGELEGERGPWVGVEVPVSESWGAEKLENRSWNDGTWGGRRYFDIGSSLEWEEAEERRKRRKEESSILSRAATLKREGEQLTVGRPKRLRSVSPAVSDASAAEARGLFVRPSDVIYVVDAEHTF